MRLNKKASQGFTLIELMIVVAIVGVLAVLAVYGVRKYIANAKTAEAKNSLGQIGKDAATAFEKESMAGTVLTAGSSAGVSRQLCSSSSKVPTAIGAVTGKKYQSAASDWNAGSQTQGWRCLKFQIDAPQYYMYEYVALAPTTATGSFAATATGDLDGNSTTSLFEIDGAITNGSMALSPNIIETNPEE